MRTYKKEREALLATLLRRGGVSLAALVLSYAQGTPEVSFTRRADGLAVAETVLAR